MATNITKVKYEKATMYGVEQNISVWVTYTGGDKWSVPINDNDNTKWQEVQSWVAVSYTHLTLPTKRIV